MSEAIALCTYRVKPGQEARFEALLKKHWPTLRGLGLVTAHPSEVFRGTDESGGNVYTEIFAWTDEAAVDEAHNSPEVMAVWEPMALCVEDRAGRPGMEFPHVERLDLGFEA